MANKAQNVGGGMRATGDAPPKAKPGGEAIDVSHLRPLSEGVLKTAGFHGGLDKSGNVRDLRGNNEGAVDLDPFELPSDELHVQLARMAENCGGVISRDVNSDGSSTFKLVYGDGDTMTAKDADAKVAAKKLLDNMGGKKS